MIPDQSPDDEIDLAELSQTILGEWRLVLGGFLATVVLAGVYAFVLAQHEYRSVAAVRGLEANYCPLGLSCSPDLEASMENAVTTVNTAAGFAALDSVVDLSGDPFFFRAGEENGDVRGARRVFDAITVTATGARASVTVIHEDDTRSVAIANAITGYLKDRVLSDARANLAAAERNLSLRLSNLPPVSPEATPAERMIAVERASLLAQLQNLEFARSSDLPVTVIDTVAQLPAERAAPRRALILALGGVLGLGLGVALAVVASMRRGRLHAASAIGAAFGIASPISTSQAEIAKGTAEGLWRELRVHVGRSERPVIALSGEMDPDLLKRAATGLSHEFQRAGQPAAIVDLGGWFDSATTPSDLGEGIGAVSTDQAVTIHSCDGASLPRAMSALAARGATAILLPPMPQADLPLLCDVFNASNARVHFAQKGKITRPDVNRILLAEREATGPRALVVM